jgi:ankyrin repeat protein
MAETRPTRWVPGLLVVSLVVGGTALVLAAVLALGWSRGQREGEPTSPKDNARGKPKGDPTPRKDDTKVVYAERLARMREAIEAGQLSRVEDLLRAGASPNDCDDQGETPLLWAAARGRRFIMLELLARGADVGHKNAKGKTPLMLARANGHEEVVAILDDPVVALRKAPKAPLPRPPVYEERWLRFKAATEKGQLSIVEALLKDGARVHDRYENNETPLMMAAAHGHVQLLAFLMSKGANLDDRDTLGQTALMRAAENGHYSCVALLLVRHYSAAVPAQKGFLEWAEIGNVDAILKALPRTSANWQHADASGETAFMKASKAGKLKVVETLWNLHENIRPRLMTARDKQGRHALAHAAAGGHSTVVASLLELVDVYKSYPGAEGTGTTEGWYAYVANEDRHGQTPLEMAETRGHKEVVALLQKFVKARLDRHYTRSSGGSTLYLTPLVDAAHLGQHRRVVSLLKLGADRTRAYENYYATPLMVAAEAGHLPVVKALLDSFGKDRAALTAYVNLTRSTSVTYKDYRPPQTALQRAEAKGHKEIVELLKKALME